MKYVYFVSHISCDGFLNLLNHLNSHIVLLLMFVILVLLFGLFGCSQDFSKSLKQSTNNIKKALNKINGETRDYFEAARILNKTTHKLSKITKDMIRRGRKYDRKNKKH